MNRVWSFARRKNLKMSGKLFFLLRDKSRKPVVVVCFCDKLEQSVRHWFQGNRLCVVGKAVVFQWL
ncbi:MAG: hypothetical protein CMJ74_08860 [Planctomycetaceae bacterium]|nr:hypothetical protein [Planctomycetaceae bacterium]